MMNWGIDFRARSIVAWKRALEGSLYQAVMTFQTIESCHWMLNALSEYFAKK